MTLRPAHRAPAPPVQGSARAQAVSSLQTGASPVSAAPEPAASVPVDANITMGAAFASPVTAQVVDTLGQAPRAGRPSLTAQIAALRQAPRAASRPAPSLQAPSLQAPPLQAPSGAPPAGAASPEVPRHAPLTDAEVALRARTDPRVGDTDAAYAQWMNAPVPADLASQARAWLGAQKALWTSAPKLARLPSESALPILRLIDPRFGRLPRTIHDVHSHETHGARGGFGTYEMKFAGNLPAEVRGDAQKEGLWLVDRLREQATLGKTVVFAVEPHLPAPKGEATWTTVSPDGRNIPGYYLSRDEHGRTIMGQDGFVSNDQIAFDRYGNQVTTPFRMPVAEFERQLGVQIPPGTESLSFVTSLVDCDLHYPDVVIDRWHAENHAALMKIEERAYGTQDMAEQYILGLTAGNPVEQGSARHVFDSLAALNQVEAGYEIPAGALKAIWGETNLSKEVVHEMGGQVPLSRMPPDQLKNLDAWTQGIGQTGMPVIIHCDSGTPAQGLNKVTSNLATFLLPSNLQNVDALVAYAGRNPETDIVWAHAGLGFTVQMPPGYLNTLQSVLDRAPNVAIDISWDAIHGYMQQDLPGWASFIARNRDRILFGSDTIATTQNPTENSRIDVARNLSKIGLLEQLDIIDPSLKDLLFSGNFRARIEAGVERAIAFRTDPENRAWLARKGHQRGEAPPRVWTKKDDGTLAFGAR